MSTVHNVTFHGIGEPPRTLEAGEAHVWISTEKYLAILDGVRGRDDVRISFDDGNRSDVDVALPALVERGLTATFFVLADRLDEEHHLGATDLRRLVEAGMTVGSHGLRHRDWRRIGDDDLADEVAESRRVLAEAADAPVTEASIPFGSYDRRVLTALRRDGGYRHVFTSDGGHARRDAWLQPRTSVTADDDVAAFASPARDTRVAEARRSAKRLAKRWR
jgi:peptidoglycan/xylan/chitin deacetylase (PgdA/CDA1 family)